MTQDQSLLKSISPSAVLAELVYGTITALAVTNTLWYALRGSPDADTTLIIAALGANAAWGVADAMIYLLTVMVENRRAYNLAVSVRTMDHEEAMTAITDDFSGTVLHTMDEDERDIWVNAVHAKLKRIEPHMQRLTINDGFGALSCFLISIAAAVPVLIPHLFTSDVQTAVIMGNVIGLVMMFVLGFVWAGRMRGPRWQAGLIMVIIGVTILTVVTLIGG